MYNVIQQKENIIFSIIFISLVEKFNEINFHNSSIIQHRRYIQTVIEKTLFF